MKSAVSRWLVLVVVVVLSVAAGACSANPRPEAGDMPMEDEGMGMDEEGSPEYGEGEGAVCGGIQGLPCPDGQFCELPAGECRSADLQGTCVVQPEVCTKEFRPVCGCDGKTYGNDCERRAAGVQKDHDGECR